MLNSILSTPVSFVSFMLCLGTALVLGVLTSIVFSYKHRLSSSLSFTLVILPVAMCMVIMMINGNLGLAVSVAGSFTLVRFRSIAGTGREISAIFVDMALGVITGMGYLGIAAVFFAVVAVTALALTVLHFGEGMFEKMLKVTLPDSYDYTDLFDDVFRKYGITASIERIKTTNLGSLIEVTYLISLPDSNLPKAFLDDIRAKNANLEVQISSAAELTERL